MSLYSILAKELGKLKNLQMKDASSICLKTLQLSRNEIEEKEHRNITYYINKKDSSATNFGLKFQESPFLTPKPIQQDIPS